MTLVLDDVGSIKKLTIKRGNKIALKRSGKSIKSLIGFVYNNTKKENVKASIVELGKMFKLMKGGVTTIKIKE